jgi:hypothetical protein
MITTSFKLPLRPLALASVLALIPVSAILPPVTPLFGAGMAQAGEPPPDEPSPDDGFGAPPPDEPPPDDGFGAPPPDDPHLSDPPPDEPPPDEPPTDEPPTDEPSPPSEPEAPSEPTPPAAPPAPPPAPPAPPPAPPAPPPAPPAPPAADSVSAPGDIAGEVAQAGGHRALGEQKAEQRAAAQVSAVEFGRSLGCGASCTVTVKTNGDLEVRMPGTLLLNTGGFMTMTVSGTRVSFPYESLFTLMLDLDFPDQASARTFASLAAENPGRLKDAFLAGQERHDGRAGRGAPADLVAALGGASANVRLDLN